MKNILVLTDFSDNARAAENYALQLAIHLEGNLVLYNAFSLQRERISGNIVWPHGTPSSELQSISNLQTRVNDLNNTLRKSGKDFHRPEISHLGNAGSLTEKLNEVITQNGTWLTVMGTKGESFASNVLFGSNVFKVLDTISSPLLIIPGTAEFGELKKIAYATDFESPDMEITRWLYEMSGSLNLELLLLHISTVKGEESGQEILRKQEKNYRAEFPGIELHIHEGDSVQQALHDITGQMNIGMLALLHRRKEFFESIFKASVSHKMIRHTEIPVLVFGDK